MRKNLVKFSGAVSELCEWIDKQTDRQTDILITILRTPPGRSKNVQSYQHAAPRRACPPWTTDLHVQYTTIDFGVNSSSRLHEQTHKHTHRHTKLHTPLITLSTPRAAAGVDS